MVGSDPPPVAIRGRRSIASAIERIEDFALDAGANPRTVLEGTEKSDDPAEFVQRSMLDAYATADRLQKLAPGADEARYPQSSLEEWLGLPAKAATGGEIERLPLFRA
jgi:hypothetical protein